MAAYVIVQVNITDPAKYDEYKKHAPAAIAKYEGRYLARGGAVEDLEGAIPYSRVVILEFPTMDKARAWYHSPEYQAAKRMREGGGEGMFTLVQGID